MSRNRYAVILLVVLALTLWLAGRYVNRTTATLCNELQTACTLAETGQLPQAQQPDLKPAARLCQRREPYGPHPRDGPGLLSAATDTAIIFRQFLIGCPACPSILP